MTNSKKECKNKDCRKWGRTEEMIKLPRGGYVCNHDCTMAIVIQSREDKRKRALEQQKWQKKQDKKIDDKVKKMTREHNANNRSLRTKEAQKAFNSFVRKRDEKLPCISCGRVKVEWTRGGQWDCGHFISIGSHYELRFVEDNAHKQCKKCNGGAGKFTKKNHTVSKEYRIKLIEKIGIEAVEFLEGPHEAKHYSCADLKEIELKYKKKLKDLEKLSH